MRDVEKCRHAGSAEVEVFVTDENDHDPVLADGGTLKVVEVAEGNRVGAVIGRLSATDADQGLNAQLTFSLRALEDTPDNVVHVVADSGELVATSTFDHETRQEYR